MGEILAISKSCLEGLGKQSGCRKLARCYSLVFAGSETKSLIPLAKGLFSGLGFVVEILR